MQITCYGATGEVTGSCHLLEVAGQKVLLDCGLIQGRPQDELRNRDDFPFNPTEIDAVILSHAHIDHSGRLPLLVQRGFSGPIYTHAASADLCQILLRDSAYIHEREAVWENKKRERKGLDLIEPIYTIEDAGIALDNVIGLQYDKAIEFLSGINLTLLEAGHILGSAIVQLKLTENGLTKTLIFSGDLGHRDSPILRNYVQPHFADLVLMESTYGDRNHKPWSDTFNEVNAIVKMINQSTGNVLIPAFSVGRSQTILYMFAKYFKEWRLNRWQIFLDSPMAIEATEVYAKHTNLYDENAANFWQSNSGLMSLPNLHHTKSAADSMRINQISGGAIIIAGSGMCTGGRIKHHLKHNIWQRDCHVVINGFQASGTTGRDLVNGCKHIKLWGESVRVAAQIHTIGGLSAHADQSGLCEWYAGFKNKPKLLLVHGEPDAMTELASKLNLEHQAPVEIAVQAKAYTI